MDKNLLLLLILILFLLPISSTAQLLETEETPAASPTTEQIPATLKPLVDAFSPWLRKLNVIVGGIFGLYVILILVRIYYERKKMKILQQIRYNLDNLTAHFGLQGSRKNNGLFRKVMRWLRALFLPRHPDRKK